MGQLRIATVNKDKQQLVEELRVHQEEMELQNEELRRAQAELEKSRSEHAEFYQLAPIGYLTINRSLKIIEGNGAVAKLFNIDTKLLLHSYITRFVPSESQIQFMEHLHLASKNGTHSVDLRMGRSGTLNFIAHLITYVVSNGEALKYRMIVEDITDRKKAEEALKESEQRLRTVLENSLDGINMLDLATGHYVVLSPAQVEMTGFTAEEMNAITAEEASERTHPEDRQMMIAQQKRVAAGEDTGEPVEYRWKVKSGKYRWFSDWSKLVRDYHGRPVALVGISRDITERKKAEDQLAFQAGLLANVHDALVATDENFAITYWNKAAERMFGWTSQEVIGKMSDDLLQTRVPSSSREEAIKKMLQENGYDGEVHYKRKDGSYILTHERATVLRDSNGNFEGTMSAFNDITERKKAEGALEESEEKYRSLFENSLQFIGIYEIVNNEDGEIVDWILLDANLPLEQQSGMPLGSMRGKRVTELWGLEDSKEGIARSKEIMATGEGQQFEMIWGETSYLASVFPIGRNRLAAVGVDITERKRAEEDLKRSNEELQQFAYIASHDLREPLRMVSSFLDLLEEKYKGKVLDEKANEYIDYAVDGADRMEQMINDLLTYSRVETRGKPFSPVEMNGVLATALKDLRASIEESGASNTHTDLPSVMADQTQMVLLLENLIGNSIKFRSEEAPQIHVSARRRGQAWLFSVRDNGIGIPKEQQIRLFQMFQRLHTRDEYEGTGIGLAICKKIVERHRGRIWVESEEGKGSTFFFTIPVRRKSIEP